MRFSIVFAAAAAVGLLYVLGIYIPEHVRHFAEVAARLPLETRAAITASHWATRLFPYLLVLVVAALAVALGVVVALYRKAPSPGAIRVATAGAFLLAAGEVLVSVLLVYAVRAAY